MSTDVARFYQLDELREFINQKLCEREQLEIGAFPLQEQFLHRAGRYCGVIFTLHGPRAVTVTAIWETDRNMLLFYDSTGERFSRISLTMAPTLLTPDVCCELTLT